MSEVNQDLYVGHYPLQKGRGSAYEMVEDGNIPEPAVGPRVPRPDIKIDTVKWISTFLGFLGIDHFYARSPTTGIAKLLTVGGMGFWWLWDALQLWTEQDRVLNYGMSAPFDLLTGIGQGMFTDLSSTYIQGVPSFVVSLAKIFGFMGFYHIMADEPAPGMRMFIIGIVGIVIGYALINMILSIIRNKEYWLIIFVFFLLIPFFWFIGNIVMELASYGLIDTSGSIVKMFENKILNYFNHGPGYIRLLSDLQDRQNIAIHAIKEEKLRHKLALRHKSEPFVSNVKYGNPFMAIPYFLEDLVYAIYKRTPWGRAEAAAKIILNNGNEVIGKITSHINDKLGSEAKSLLKEIKGNQPIAEQVGGGREEITVESQILGASVAAIIGGGSIKLLVDYLTS